MFAGPTLAGNIVGGSFIFALISHAQIRSDVELQESEREKRRARLAEKPEA
ncbi:Inner membrane protein YfdC [compost metagenome]